MITTGQHGMPVFDIEKGFKLERLKDGRFAYVNHAIGLRLPSWPSNEQAEVYRMAYLATPDAMNTAAQRYDEEYRNG